MILRRIILIAISFIAGASIGRKACSIIAKWQAKGRSDDAGCQAAGCQATGCQATGRQAAECQPAGDSNAKIKNIGKSNIIMFPMDRIRKGRMENAGSN